MEKCFDAVTIGEYLVDFTPACSGQGVKELYATAGSRGSYYAWAGGMSAMPGLEQVRKRMGA